VTLSAGDSDPSGFEAILYRFQPRYGGHNCLNGLTAEENSGAPINDRVESLTPTISNDRLACSHRFSYDYLKILFTRKHEGTARIVIGQAVGWLSAQQSYGRSSNSFESFVFLAIADNNRSPSGTFIKDYKAFRNMSRMDASRRKANALRLRFSKSLARRRQRLSQAIMRSTLQRFGRTTNPLA
jgi:hypothetical protein